MTISLTQPDTLKYEAIKKTATTDVLNFRVTAREHARQYPRALRKRIRALNSKDTSAYEFFTMWTQALAPEVEMLLDEERRNTLATTIAGQLGISKHAAEERAERLVREQVWERAEAFIDTLYGLRGRRYRAARALLARPVDEVADSRDRFVAYMLDGRVARKLNLVIYDAHASLLTRWRQRGKDRRQTKRYMRRQAVRLKEIRARQEALKAERRGIMGRVLTIELDTVLALDAYRQYNKRLEALKPTSRTPAKTLALFTAATKTIRDGYAGKLTTLDKLADLQYALKEVDSVLVEIFDMTDSERNALMVRLKEYRELEREAVRIVKEQTVPSSVPARRG